MLCMKRDSPYPSDENFYICGLLFEDYCFERDLKVRVITQSKVFLKIGVPKSKVKSLKDACKRTLFLVTLPAKNLQLH